MVAMIIPFVSTCIRPWSRGSAAIHGSQELIPQLKIARDPFLESIVTSHQVTAGASNYFARGQLSGPKQRGNLARPRVLPATPLSDARARIGKCHRRGESGVEVAPERRVADRVSPVDQPFL